MLGVLSSSHIWPFCEWVVGYFWEGSSLEFWMGLSGMKITVTKS